MPTKIYFKKRIPEPALMEKEEYELFKKISERNYKRWIIPLIDDLFDKFKKNFNKPIKKFKKIKILDAACGPGFLTKGLAKFSKNIYVVGVDYSDIALKQAEEVNKWSKNVRFIKSDIHNLPFNNESFDIVVCKDSFHHLKDPYRAISELYRVFKKNGILYIQDIRRDMPWYLLKMVIPPDSLFKKLLYYSARASYTPLEIKKVLRKLKIKNYLLYSRKLTKELKKKYIKIGINIKELKQSFRSRFVLVIFKQ